MDLRVALDNLSNCVKNGGVPKRDSMLAAITAIKKEIKYSWHNIEKNHNDLPKDHMVVLAMIRHQDKVVYRTAYHTDENGWMFGKYGEMAEEPKVVKWCFINKVGAMEDIE